MIKRFLCLLLLSSVLSVSYGQDLIERTQQGIAANPSISQTQTRIYTDIGIQKKSRNSDIHHLFTFDKTQSKSSTHETELSKAPVYLELNIDQLEKLNAAKTDIIQLAIPVDDENYFMLTLREFNCLSASFDAITNTGQHLDFSSVRTFRGYVKDDPTSTVSMTLTNGQLKLLIADNQGNYSLGKFQNKESQYVLLNDSSHKQQNEFVCGAKTTTNQIQNYINTATQKSSSSSVGCIDIYVEMAHDLYLSNGTAESSVFNGIALFNEVATIYSNENIDINISYLKVWTSADPYANMTNIDNVLDLFGDNMQNSFNGDLAHLLKATQIGGGVAWIDQLGLSYCSNCGEGGSSTGPYGVSSGIGSTVVQYPTYSWSVMVIAHELGHNFGSPHTHDCFWNGTNTAIDGCQTPAPCANPGLPSGGGTIMSYCHQQPSIGINLAAGFGSQPGNLIRAKTTTAINNNLVNGTCSCSVPCTDDFVLEYFSSVYNSSWGFLHPRLFGDVNGDGKDDIVGFASSGVRVALSTGSDIVIDWSWNSNEYGYATGWNTNSHPRHLIDVNGDGKDDIVGFSPSNVLVSLSTGNNFTVNSLWIPSYGSNSGWSIANNPRLFGDFNNDGLNDFVGFANAITVVVESTGNSFERNPDFNLNHFYFDQGWSSYYPRMVGDIDGDGYDDDIVGFGPNAVQAVTSNGIFFSAVTNWTTEFTANNGGWSPSYHPRFLADVNGDGRDDIVAFSNANVLVGLSTGSNFATNQLWRIGFGFSSGWTVEDHPRYMADVNGDGMEDIVGYANAGVYIALSNGSSFDVPILIQTCYGNSDYWSSVHYIRKYADFSGDGILDIVAMGCGGTYVHFMNNNDCTFAKRIPVTNSCTPSTNSNIENTASDDAPAFSCGIPGATIDSYFKLIVPPSGKVTIETTQIPDGLTDMIMQVLSGSCGSFTEIACDDDSGDGSHSLIHISNRPSGEILYVRVVEYGSNKSGEFGICAYDEAVCPSNFEGVNQLTGTQSTIADFESNGVITSDQIIDADTDYDSGTQLYLLQGFEVNMGKIFHAFIDGCGGSQ